MVPHDTMTDQTFEKPAPGTWLLDSSHFPRPFSYWMQEVYPPAMTEGTKRSYAHYGALLDGLQVQPVNGFLYLSRRPLVGPAEPSGPPPKLVFKLLLRLHPTLRRRVSRMAETFETKRWREDVETWDSAWKPEILEINRELEAVTPSELDDRELVDHIAACRRTLSDWLVRHHRLDLCAFLPIGDFLVQTVDWTGRSESELMELFGGTSPVSRGAMDELETLVAAIDRTGDDRSLLFSDASPEEVIDDLRSRSGPAAEATEDWLDVVGYRIVSGYDVADVYALEEPSVLVNTLRAAVEGTSGGPTETDADDRVTSIRREVPAEHRAEFDELYREARLTYRIRDDRSGIDLETLGLTRRALLEAGRRLVDRGRLEESTHVVDLRHDELVAGLRGEPAPSPDEVATRVTYRTTHDSSDAPARLGPPPPPPPPLEWMPDSTARGMRAIGTFVETMLGSGEEQSDDRVVRGLGASPGSFEGTARVVSGPEDFSKIRNGDVLVTEATSPAFNVVLPLLGGVVTDNGGVLSHAAIVSREFGIPGVVGCSDATKRIQDGTPVVIDGGEGTVRIVP